jgi:hypothetical protein
MAKAPRVTIQDVAALSGLFIRTVSRALRHLPNFSDKAHTKVADAAALEASGVASVGRQGVPWDNGGIDDEVAALHAAGAPARNRAGGAQEHPPRALTPARRRTAPPPQTFRNPALV